MLRLLRRIRGRFCVGSNGIRRLIGAGVHRICQEADPENDADDAILCQMFDVGGSKKEMCAYFKRSEGSLAARLVRLGKISGRAEFRMK